MIGNKRHLIADDDDEDKQGKNQGGEGQSRAAKKRAKKKKKTQQQLQQKQLARVEDCHIEKDLVNDGSNENMSDPKIDSSKDAIKEMELDVASKKEKKSIKNKKRKGNKVKSKNDLNDDEADDNDDAVGDEDDKLLERFLSVLSPFEILFPSEEDENDHDTGEGMEGDEKEPDPKAVLREVTAEKRARSLFNSILSPSGILADEFYNEYWEQQPLLITNPRLNNGEQDSKNGNKDTQKDTIEKFANNFYEQYLNPKKGGNENHQVDNNSLKVAAAKSKEEDNSNYHERFDGFLSKKDISKLIKKYPMQYGKDLNVTKYCKDINGEMRRITLDLYPENLDSTKEDVEYVVAEPKDVWSNFEDGCSVRLLCPHKYNDRVYALLSTLELEFGCMVGANAYLTPGPASSASGKSHQGFAPHYDDIEAFVLQLEGYKRWKVYPPMNKGETLPRESSSDYSTQEIEDSGPPVLDIILGPGDVLYMPRGWIHQAYTPSSSEIKNMLPKAYKKGNNDNNHSLHLTVSVMQNWSWVDLMEIIIPEAIEAAAKSTTSTSLREGLPRNFLSYMGAIHDLEDDDKLPEGLKQLAKVQSEASPEGEDEGDLEEKRRLHHLKSLQNKFREEAKKKIMRVCKEAMGLLDAGCDQIAKRFLSDRLPPYLSKEELLLTSDNREGNGGKIWPNTMIRLTRPNVARLVLEDDKAVLYHCADNSRVFHGNALSPMEFELDDAPAIEMILKTSEPHWIRVSDLIHGDIEDKMEIAQVLFDEGILTMLQTDAPDKSVQTG